MTRPRHPGISDANIVALSLVLESETGAGSVETIEKHYEGRCVMPGCAARHTDAIAMWRHVHFAGHGRSFGVSWADLPTLAARSGAHAPDEHQVGGAS